MKAGMRMKKTDQSRILEELQLLQNITHRHDIIAMLWKFQGEDGLPQPLFISENIECFGYNMEAYRTKKIIWTDLIYEEDRQKAGQETYYYIMNGGTRFIQEYRIQNKNKALQWVRADNVIVRDETGKATYIETVIMDIQETKLLEQKFLESQERLQREWSDYHKSKEEKNIKDIFQEFLMEQKIEMLQNTFTTIYQVHAAIIGVDYDFYTYMTGPEEDEGIFYDISELKEFHEKFYELNRVIQSGQRMKIMKLKYPKIKIGGAPIYYEGKHIATWVVCCLAEKDTEKFIKILQFISIMADNITGYFNRNVELAVEKGGVPVGIGLKRQLEMQDKLFYIYDKMQDIVSEKEMLPMIMREVGKAADLGRIAIYEYLKSSVYVRCRYEWIDEDIQKQQDKREIISVKAMPSPKRLLEKNKIIVLNSIRIPKEWRDTFGDLNSKAAILIPLKFGAYNGFICYLEVLKERIWDNETIKFLEKSKKIIEKVLLKSE